jgi:hypothetical protein
MNESGIPLHKLMPQGAQTALIIASGLICAAVWVYAIAESRRRRDLIPVLIVAGCGLAIFYEPLGDMMAKVYYTERGQDVWIHSFGRNIPVFIGILYFWYMSLGALWLLRQSRRGVTLRQWWARWVGYLVFATALEMFSAKVLGNAQGAPWIYYGKQAFMVLQVPLFTPWTYVSIPTMVAIGTVAMARFVPKRLQLLILPGAVMCMVAGHAMTAFPSALANNSTNSTLLLDLGAIGSAIFALTLAYVGSIAYRAPWAPSDRVLEPIPVARAGRGEVPDRDPQRDDLVDQLLA